MSKVTIRQWKAPIDERDREKAATSLGHSLDDDFTVNLLEKEPILMAGTESSHPLVVSPEKANGPIVLAPQPRPMASNYFYEHTVTWRAEYADGAVRHQRGELGKELSTDHLSREGLRRFVLTDTKLGTDIVAHNFEPGDMLFYRRRTAMRPGEDVVEVLHILGKTRSKEGPNEIYFLYESDKRIEEGDFNDPADPANHVKWRYPLNWHEADLVPVS